LADIMLAHYIDPVGGFFDTSDDHEALITRPKDVQDNAVPSGNALASSVLLKLSAFTGEERYARHAESLLSALQPAMAQAPLGFAQWLCALEFAVSQPCEIAIVGDSQSGDTQALLAVVRAGYRPNQVVALTQPDRSSAAIPLLQDRLALNGQATVYVCQHFTCQRPTTDPAILKQLLA
jgi:uncharacterized protein YyaL (SSP411 family)